jgi:hypothetical protein
MTERSSLATRRPPPASALVPPDGHEVWTAEIEWRQTNAGARFCVVARGGDGTREVNVAESRPLDWPPQRGDSVRALGEAAEELEAAVLAAGWRPLPPGSTWYAKRFSSEPAAEAAPLGPAAPAPPAWVQPVGLEAPAHPQPADPAPASGDPPVIGSGRFISRPTFPLALVALLVVASAVAGSLLARALGDGSRDAASAVPLAASPLTIVHDGLSLQVPSGWGPGVPALAPGFSHPLFLENKDERLNVIVERLPATSASLLPLALEHALPAARERRDSVELASGRSAWRYRAALADGSAIVVYTAPTTSGVATLACTSPPAGGVPSGCDALVDGLTVPGSLPLDPGPSAAFFSRLPAVVERLDAARSASTRELSAATRAAEQAAAADGLARGHKAASGALTPLAAGGLPVKLVDALGATAAAYASLAGAARARSPQRYGRASRAVAGADAVLHRRLSQAAAAAKAATGGAAP